MDQGFVDYNNKLLELGIKAYSKEDGLLYHYTSLVKAKLIIGGCKLMFSKPNDLNDPFDFPNNTIDVNYDWDSIKDLVNRRMKSKTRKEKRDIMRDRLKDQTHLQKRLHKMMEKEKEKMGVCCFSKIHNDTLMWSHYADGHKGVCLGFNFSPISITHSLFMFYVNYVESIKPLNYVKYQEAALLNWFFTKSKKWEHEKEIRALFVDYNGLIPFEKKGLSEIYFGARVSEIEMQNLQNLLTTNQYSIHKSASMVLDDVNLTLSEKTI